MKKTESKSEKFKIQTGIVGIFDILGYSSFLENNDVETTAKHVLSKMLSIKKETIKQYKFPIKVPVYFDRFGCNVFSDTILITDAYEDDADETEKLATWFLFFSFSTKLWRWMFSEGLPLRGSITFGRFIVEENCFAGKSIVDAFKDSHNLKLAACVIHPDAVKELDRLIAVSKNDPLKRDLGKQLVDYPAPQKDQEDTDRRSMLRTALDITDEDIRQQVLNSFWKHNKDIPAEAQDKVDNTEQFLRFLKSIQTEHIDK